jgi:RsmE family RNA methyltransferase
VNIVLIEPDELIGGDRVHIRGRRLDHVRGVLGAAVGDELRVGIVNGKTGTGRIERIGDDAAELTVRLEGAPSAPPPLRLILALPRPKVLNRMIAAAASMGIPEIDLINSWRVEKSYWNSPRLSDENLRMQSLLGLEQGGDTMLPTIRIHRLFAPFVRSELPETIDGRLALIAHPGGAAAAPRHTNRPVVLAIGPEGGFIDREVDAFREIGFSTVSLGPRILRVETALACMIGRLF